LQKDKNVLRVVVRESHSEDLIEHLILDCVWAYETLFKQHHNEKNKDTTEQQEKEQLLIATKVRHGTC
jgi:hypothetical protein